QLKEDVVERRPSEPHVADADPRAAELGGGLLDEDEALSWRRQRESVRSPVLLGCAAADAKERSLSRVALVKVGQLDFEKLAADAVLQLVTGSFCDHATVVDDRDFVGELIRLFEVLGGQQNRCALAAQ